MTGSITEPVGEKKMYYAHFGKRTVAWIIDCALLGLINYFLNSSFSEDPSKPSSWLIWVNVLIAWQYEALSFSSHHQATLGKRLMSICIANENGQRISFGKATQRHFCKYLSAFTLLVGFLMALFTEKHQTLHDKLAGTLALKRPYCLPFEP